MAGDVDVGLQGDADQATKAALRSVTHAGGAITRPIFAFPGGNKLAVDQAE